MFLAKLYVFLLHLMTVKHVKYRLWNEADVTWWDRRCSYRCCWCLQSSGMRRFDIGRVAPNILKDHCAVKTPGTTFPMTHCHIPEDWYPQGCNLLQTNKCNSQIHVFLTNSYVFFAVQTSHHMLYRKIRFNTQRACKKIQVSDLGLLQLMSVKLC
jgi:hypothetical protein